MYHGVRAQRPRRGNGPPSGWPIGAVGPGLMGLEVEIGNGNGHRHPAAPFSEGSDGAGGGV